MEQGASWRNVMCRFMDMGSHMKMPASAVAFVIEERFPKKAHFSPDEMRSCLENWAWELQVTGSRGMTKKVKVLSWTVRKIISLLLEGSCSTAGSTWNSSFTGKVDKILLLKPLPPAQPALPELISVLCSSIPSLWKSKRCLQTTNQGESPTLFLREIPVLNRLFTILIWETRGKNGSYK